MRMKRKLFSLLALMAFCVTTAMAQNVTISPKSGYLISAKTYSTESGAERGWAALWRHNQLPLTLLVSDKSDLTDDGMLKDPAGNISLDASQGLYCLCGGMNPTTRMSISLPKGFRFTHYRIVLLNNTNGKTINNMTHQSMRKRLYETGNDFNINASKARTDEMGANNDTKEYVIERTNRTATDMGNNLYFYFWRERNEHYGATIKSIELYFTAQGSFTSTFAPTTTTTNGVNMIGMPFATGRLDLGEITQQSKNDVKFLGYDYNNVKDLTANAWLYQEDAVVGNTLPTTAGAGKITTTNSHYALGNGTYYIESPTSAIDQTGNSIPLGYRITGTKLNASAKSNGFYIYATKVGESTRYYLDTNLNYSTTPTVWYWDGSKLTSNGVYLTAELSWGLRLSKTTNKNDASDFTQDESGHLYFEGHLGNYYISASWNNQSTSATGSFTQDSPNNAANASVAKLPSSSYNIAVYGTDKDNSVESATINADNENQTLTASNLNNDAVKFVISGLADGEKAMLTFSLDMENLNPYVRSFDVVAHATTDKLASVKQEYDTNDFKVSGNKLILRIPEGFAGADNKVAISFENLNSQYATPDYNIADVVDDPRARIYFVGSQYYNSYGDGKQYSASPNAEASTKVVTRSAGNKQFKFSNADELDRNTTSTTSTSLKEYAFSMAQYNSQGGSFDDNAQATVGADNQFYIFIGDETRHNIAPTTAMEHRYYAYYTLQMELLVKTYSAKCTLTEIYDKTCYDGDKTDAMYGASFQAIDGGETIPASEGATLSVQQMKDALTQALTEKNATAKQVLYLDFGDLANVIMNASSDITSWQGELNANCLMFLPAGTTFTNANNIVRRTATGGFLATGNIIITDKQPFFSPYSITVPAENYASYTRQVTVDANGKVSYASIILPFEIDLTKGVHINRDDHGTFRVSQINTNDCLTLADEETAAANNYKADAKFSIVADNSTKANTPYMVEVFTSPDDFNFPFIATQYGSAIAATPTSDMSTVDYTFKGEEATGTINGTNYNFVNYGSYSGQKLDKTTGYFYFAGNMFLSSKNLVAQRPWLYVYPFRAYYAYQSSGNAKDIDKFGITFSEGTTTGIDDITTTGGDTTLKIVSGQGAITLTANQDKSVSIISATGAMTNRLDMRAGETRTVSVPAGIYIVNNVKTIVK